MLDTTQQTITFNLNGKQVSAQIQPQWTLVDLLHNRFDLYGARQSCGQGLCGCCSVVVDGKAVSGCLYLAIFADGATVTTIENNEDELDIVQQAFIEAGAFQCSFCTPGFITMTRQLLQANPDPDVDDIKHYLTGNLCRCGAYPQIIAAVQMAAEKMRASAS